MRLIVVSLVVGNEESTKHSFNGMILLALVEWSGYVWGALVECFKPGRGTNRSPRFKRIKYEEQCRIYEWDDGRQGGGENKGVLLNDGWGDMEE